ncbi:MAG: carboxypeptidase-like regulatory domain-containing protein, partial [Bacteroidota bacterium]
MVHSYAIYRLLQFTRVHTVSFIAFVLMFLCNTLNAQHEISGTIVDESGAAVNGVVIICSDATGQILAHDVSNTEGKYLIAIDQATTVELSITHLSYEEIYTKLQLKGERTTWDCTMKESSNLLDQIMIKADYKKKDTIEFSLENLNIKEADNLKKILEQIPSFLVGEGGTIFYEGKSINKILVNEEVAFINQNTTALNSIQARMIENIDVIHNHQNVFEISFNEIRETVLNIDTKESARNIFSGVIAAEYGTSNTYNLSGDLMKFSKGLSMITTNNINSIGQKEMDQSEVQSLFRPETPLSHYQENLLQNLFEERQDFTSNRFSHSTATVRRRNDKLKLDGTFYRINNKLAQSSIFDVQDLDQTFSSENTSIEEVSGNSYLGNGAVAYKLSPTSIISCDIYVNRLQGYDNMSVAADQFNSLMDTTVRNELLGSRNIQSSLLDQSVSYHNKVSEKNILFVKGRMANESSLFNGSNDVNAIPFLEDIGYQYKNQINQYDMGIKSKFSKYFVSSFALNYSEETEEINMSAQSESTNRVRKTYAAKWKAWGDFSKKLHYKLSSSLISERHVLSNGQPLDFLYVPFSVRIEYERRKHNWLFKVDRNYGANNIEHTLDIMEPLQFNNGSIDNITQLNRSENWMAQYTYNDIFEGKRLSVKIIRNRYNNDNALFFMENVSGVSSFQWFNFTERSDIGIKSNASKIIFPLKFPTKVDIGVNYTRSILPVNETENTNRNYYNASLTLKTVTDSKINYSLRSQFAKLNDRNEYAVQNYTFFANRFSVNYYDQKWDCAIHLIQESHWINGTRRNRWNINSNLSYILGKYTISMDIRHLGELLSLIDNNAYNYSYRQEGGLVYRSQRDQSLRYLLL